MKKNVMGINMSISGVLTSPLFWSILAAFFAGIAALKVIIDLKRKWQQKKEIEQADVEIRVVKNAIENPELFPLTPPDEDKEHVGVKKSSKELFWITISHEGGPVIFNRFRWWIRFLPKEREYRILRVKDAEEEDLPDLNDTSLHRSNSILLNPNKKATYDNLSYSPAQLDKKFYVIRRYIARGEWEHFSPGDVLVIPLWVEIPKIGGEDILEVQVDPPNPNIDIKKQIKIQTG